VVRRVRPIARCSLPVLLALAAARPLAAQEGAPSPAASWQAGYDAVKAMGTATSQQADVDSLVLVREAGRFEFGRGRFTLLAPVSGRIMGAYFEGEGTFTLSPASPAERAELARRHGGEAYQVNFAKVILLFSDSTLAELQHRLRFAPGPVSNDADDLLDKALDFMGDKDDHSIEPDVMLELLNGGSAGMFYAHLSQPAYPPLIFFLSPGEREGVELRERNRVGISEGSAYTTIKEAPLSGGPPVSLGDRHGDALISHYAMDISLPTTGSGDLAFQAGARLFIRGDVPLGPWIAFQLFGKFTVDSARWVRGEPATFEKPKDSPYLWVRLPAVLPPGQTAELALYYRGDLIDRYGDFFFIKGSTAWYPRSLDGRSYATFELVYHTPSNFTFASVGERMDSSTSGRMTTTRWVTPKPIRNASFNLGLFKTVVPTEPGAPASTVLVAEGAHRAAGWKAYSSDEVARDVARSLKFYTSMFGPAPPDHYYVTEIPAGHGEAFPGLIHLSALTFGEAGTEGLDEQFRAHEVAHQWWGIGVDFGTYRDQWLSEGFAEFSSLWYLQTVRGDAKQYFQILDEWKADIFVRRGKVPPISQGFRVADVDHPDDYQTIVYQKGAWVLHMLRAMMIDLKTMNEDRFTGMMKDFYQSYRGKQATTADFRRTVERHTGQAMGWFFGQWVDGTALPTYKVAWQAVQAPDGGWLLRFRVRQEGVPESFRAYVPIGIALGKDQAVRVRKQVTGALSEFEVGPFPSRPKAVTFNDLDGVLAEVDNVGWDG